MTSAAERIEFYGKENYVEQPLPEHAAAELFYNTDEDDECAWMPVKENVWSRPLMFNVTQGSWVTLLKATGTGIISRHRHPAPVTGFTLEGAWGYLERPWTSRAGGFIFEPAGDTHTLIVDPEVGHMKTIFHNFGPLLYVDAAGELIRYDDVFTRLERYKAWYRDCGLGEEFATNLIR